MKIQCRPVRIDHPTNSIDCGGCLEAWKIYRKSRKLYKKGLKKDNKTLIRRADWLTVKVAEMLYNDRSNHHDDPRQIPLIIQNGRARKIKRFRCWNCNHTLFLDYSKYHERPFCRYCCATIYNDWFEGKKTPKKIRKMAKSRSVEPYMANGIWEDYYWSKKAKDMKRRTQDEAV